MAKLVFRMNQSVDGYVDHLEMRPDPALFRHFIEQVRDMTGSVYGRRSHYSHFQATQPFDFAQTAPLRQ